MFLYWESGKVREVVIGVFGSMSGFEADSRENLKDFYRYNGTFYGGPTSFFPVGSQFVRIVSPISPEQLELGAQIPIAWESNGLLGNIKLELLKGDTYWGTIATNLPIQQQSYAWTVGNYQGGTANAGDDYKIKITMMDGSDYDTSNVNFSVVDPPSITVISPNGGENWTVGSSHDITWGATGLVEFVKIEYSVNNGASWSTVVEQTANNGVYSWIIPNTPSASCRVRVSRLADTAIQDISNASFTITPPAEAVSAPSRPTGNASGVKSKSYSFSTGGSASNLGHPLQYLFEWGDGTNSGWLPTGATSANHSWAATGTFQVRALARCGTHTAVVSPWSPLLGVIIHDETVSGLYNSPAQYLALTEAIWATASGGGTWTSAVQINDVTGGSKVSAFYSTASGRRGPFLLWDNSAGAALSSMKLDNVLQAIDAADTGIFTYFGTVGAVEFITQDGGHKIHAAARTVNGNYAKTLTAISLHDANTAAAGRDMVIPNLASNATYRSNCGFFNPTDDPVTLELKLRNASNAQVGSTVSKTLSAREFVAYSIFTWAGVPYPANSHDNVALDIHVTSGSGKAACFGATVNNASNDPAAHVAVQGVAGHDNGPSTRQVMPEAVWAAASGGGTWATEVQLIDVTGGSQVAVYFNSSGGVRRGPFALWTGTTAGVKVKYAGILERLGQLDGGYEYYGKSGAVEFVTQDASHRIQVTARTVNGNYSKTFPGLNVVDADTASSSRVMIIPNLTNNTTYRSTCGFFNPTNDYVTVEFTILSSNGALIGSTFSKTLIGHDFQSFSPFNEAGVPSPSYPHDNVILKIRPTSGAGTVMCFGASVNGTTNDPAAHLAVQGQ